MSDKIDLFRDLIPSLNMKTIHLFDECKISNKDYPSFIVNKNYSYGNDILIANMMNLNHHIDNKMQYDFYFYGLDSKKRFNKWIKKQDSAAIDNIIKYCGCSYKKAMQYAEILSVDQLKDIEECNNRMEDCV